MKKTRVVRDDLDSLIHTFYSFLKYGRLIEASWPVDLITSLKYHILALKWQISSQWFTLPRNLGLTVIVNKNYKCVCNKCQMSVPDNFKVLLVIKLAHYQLLIIFRSASLLRLRESFTFFSVLWRWRCLLLSSGFTFFCCP